MAEFMLPDPWDTPKNQTSFKKPKPQVSFKRPNPSPIQNTPVRGLGTNGINSGGLIGSLMQYLGVMATPYVADRALEGAALLTGQDQLKRDMQQFNAGRPVVRNLDGVSYNISTPEGMAAYRKAKAAGKQFSKQPKGIASKVKRYR